MPEFYSLEEAARVLGMSPEDLKLKAQHREIRAFVDGGSWRFRKPDVEEEARRRGLGSDPDLSLSDLNLPKDQDSDLDFDLSEYQIGVAPPDLAPQSIEVAKPEPLDQDLLLDDRSVPLSPASSSSSTIIGMHQSTGKQPSDSDVRLVPDNIKSASDSDVRLAGSAPSDSDVTVAGDLGSSAEVKPLAFPEGQATVELEPGHLGDSRETPAPAKGSDSDFELTPSSVIDALEPESGSDFELTALDASSDEFDTTPLRKPAGPSDSDVTAAQPSASGINLGRPSDSGINLQSVGSPFDLGSADSIELAPLDEDDLGPPAAKAPVKGPEPAAKRPGSPKPSPADMAATSVPTKQDRDIFEDTDFEVDALDTGSSEDHTVQLDAASDFEVEDSSESASEVFALDEEDVDQNAATAMAPAVVDQGEAEEFEGVSGEAESPWDVDDEVPATSSAAVRAPAISGRGMESPEWGGLWVGLLAVATVFMIFLAFVGIDVVRNLYEFQSGGPAHGLVKQIAGMVGG
jgi:hypothetical protein